MNKNRVAFISILFFLGLTSSLQAKAKNPPSPKKTVERYSLTKGEPLFPKAKKARLPFVIYGDSAGQEVPFVPSGYMGDGSSIKVGTSYESAPLASGEQGETSLRINYSAKGRNGWAGIYWLTPANNWGKIKGAGYDLTRSKQLTFWIRGDKGGEIIHEIKVGGITAGPYPDSGAATLGPLKLTKDWQQFVIDLSHVDTRHIIGGFAFVTRRIDSQKGITFYLDEIVYERDNSVMAALDKLENTKEKSPEDEGVVPAPLLKPVRQLIPFDSAFTAFDDKTKNVLDDVVDAALKHSDASVIIEGHTDNLGPAELNMRLSRERAGAVADYLAARGLERARIIVIGYGEDRPLSPDSNGTEEGRRKNRRVEVVLIKSR